MNADYRGTGNSNNPYLPSANRVSVHSAQRFERSQRWTFCVATAAGVTTTLLALQSVLSQQSLLETDDISRAITAVGFAGILAGAFSYTAIHLVKALAGSDLSEILEGSEPISRRWIYIVVLGIIIGAGVALFSSLAGTVLPLLPSRLFL